MKVKVRVRKRDLRCFWLVIKKNVARYQKYKWSLEARKARKCIFPRVSKKNTTLMTQIDFF